MSVRIKPAGDVVADKVESLRAELSAAVATGADKITVDMESVSIIDSSGIGVLISAFNSLKKKNGNLEIVNLNENITKMFKIMRLDHHFKII